MSKLAAEQKTTIRKAYVQSNLISRGIQLQDLRDLVAATDDYHQHSLVILEKQKVEVIETLATPWIRKGRKEKSDG